MPLDEYSAGSKSLFGVVRLTFLTYFVALSYPMLDNKLRKKNSAFKYRFCVSRGSLDTNFNEYTLMKYSNCSRLRGSGESSDDVLPEQFTPGSLYDPRV